MNLVNEIIEGLFMPLNQVNEYLNSLLRIFLANWHRKSFVNRTGVLQLRDYVRSSLLSTVRIRSLTKFCRSPIDSAILAAL